MKKYEEAIDVDFFLNGRGLTRFLICEEMKTRIMGAFMGRST